jgi:hypothetical protein
LFTIGAFEFIFDEQDRILLCHRRDLNVWNLPGGGIESGELPTNTGPREVETLQDAVKSGGSPVFCRHIVPSTLERLKQWEDSTTAWPAVPAENRFRIIGSRAAKLKAAQ